MNDLHSRSREGVRLTHKNKPSSRRDGLFPYESIPPKGYQRLHGEMTWFTVGIPEYPDGGPQAPRSTNYLRQVRSVYVGHELGPYLQKTSERNEHHGNEGTEGKRHVLQ